MKQWITSKTLWFNVIAGALGVLINSAETAAIDPAWQMAIVTAGNFALRWVTSTGLSINKP